MMSEFLKYFKEQLGVFLSVKYQKWSQLRMNSWKEWIVKQVYTE